MTGGKVRSDGSLLPLVCPEWKGKIPHPEGKKDETLVLGTFFSVISYLKLRES